jgi:hypothetical protein
MVIWAMAGVEADNKRVNRKTAAVLSIDQNKIICVLNGWEVVLLFEAEVTVKGR